MIIFTVTSNITAQVFVGSTRNDLESQWEKIVAAAQQDLDYPLYREIRIHGEGAFTVEVWDRAEERQELLELEQEAINHFGAKSLRGYKTSTVKILPKKKTRQRKSSIEKELASIFSSERSDTETPPSLAIKSSDSNAAVTKAAFRSVPVKTAKKPAATAAAEPTFTKETIRALAKIAAEEKAKEVAAAAEKAATIQTAAGSQANAMVQMKSINLSDDISAQLAAITAAVDAVLSGDNLAAQSLQAIKETPAPGVDVFVETALVKTAAEEAPTLEAPTIDFSPEIEEPGEVIKPVCPKHYACVMPWNVIVKCGHRSLGKLRRTNANGLLKCWQNWMNELAAFTRMNWQL